MYRYLGFSLLAGGCTAMAATLTNKLLIGKINNEYYLSREVPGQLIGLGLSLIMVHRFKTNPLNIGVLSSLLFPIGVTADVMASKSDNPVPYLMAGSILRNISYVGPAGCHTAAIVQICKSNNPNIFGTRNMVMGSLGATIGIIVGVSCDHNPILIACGYPICLYLGWNKIIR